MSKPREFWIGSRRIFSINEEIGVHLAFSDKKPIADKDNLWHVIEKSAADKLAAALEHYADPSIYKPTYFGDDDVYDPSADEAEAIEALKEYRGT